MTPTLNPPYDPTKLTLISHVLCPYVQRAVIALREKGVPFQRIDIDLADKPEWFRRLSPLGKVPVLSVPGMDGPVPLFESAAILEYLEETQPSPLHPADPMAKARDRGWIEFGSQILNRIGALYNAPTETDFQSELQKLDTLWSRLETEFGEGPWFGGEAFSLVDAVFGPIFRYYDVLDAVPEARFPTDLPKLAAWRKRLAARESVRLAVSARYPDLLHAFLLRRNSALSEKMKPMAA